MSINMEAFQAFGQMVKEMGEQPKEARPPTEQCLKIVKENFVSRIDADMAMQLESCLHCGQCAEACHYYVATGNAKYTPIRKLDLLKRVYRRELSPMRWMHKLYTKDITLEELEEWQELVYDACTECGRCSMICPAGINIASMVNVMRQSLAAAGMAPAELAAMYHEQGVHDSVFGMTPDRMQETVKQLSEKTGLEIPLNKEKVDILVLTSVVDLMLFQDALLATVKIMNHLGVSWSLSSNGYEAANFGMLSGFERVQRIASERVIKAATKCGAKLVITPECGHAYPALRWDAANLHGKKLDFDVMAISEYIGREVKAGRLKLKPIGKQKSITFHDPCKLARHSGSVEEPRYVFDALDVDFREVESSKEMNWCCGGGAGVFLLNRAAPLRQAAFEIKIDQINKTGAESVVLSCGSCRLNFLNGARGANWQTPIESLVEIVADALPDA